MELDRITFDPKILGGKACIRGMRISASFIVELVASDMTRAEIMSAYPDLEKEDIRQALSYAAGLARDQKMPPVSWTEPDPFADWEEFPLTPPNEDTRPAEP